MKFTAKQIVALFNKSKSGKSFIKIDGTTMIIVNETVHNMCRLNEISEIEFVPGQPLMDQNDNTKKVFDTMNVGSYTESAISRLQNASALCIAYDGVDQEKVTKAIELAKTITF